MKNEEKKKLQDSIFEPVPPSSSISESISTENIFPNYSLSKVQFGRKYYIGNYETESYLLEFDCIRDDGSGLISKDIITKARTLIHDAHIRGGSNEHVSATRNKPADLPLDTPTAKGSLPFLVFGDTRFDFVERALSSGKVTLSYIRDNFTFSRATWDYFESIVTNDTSK